MPAGQMRASLFAHLDYALALLRYYLRPKVERTGTCNRCGKCCERIILYVDGAKVDTPERLATLARRNPAYRIFEVAPGASTPMRIRCKELQPDGTCGNHRARPAFCRAYPSARLLEAGGDLPAECSYSFRVHERPRKPGAVGDDFTKMLDAERQSPRRLPVVRDG